jgi:predicted thioesterase
MHQLRTGLIGEARLYAGEEHSAASMGSGALPVFSTPAMIALMENAAVRAVDHLLEPGHSTVGIELHISHISATPIGEEIVAVAEVTAVEERRVTLEVRAWDETEMIGEGTHVRYIINDERFLNRLQERG